MIVTGPLMHSTHNRRENIYIFTRVPSADNFLQHDITFDRSYFQTAFMFDAPLPETQLPLARLVKAEIVSPYRGILINTGMGNPTVPSIMAHGNQAILNRQVGRRTTIVASIKE